MIFKHNSMFFNDYFMNPKHSSIFVITIMLFSDAYLRLSEFHDI